MRLSAVMLRFVATLLFMLLMGLIPAGIPGALAADDGPHSSPLNKKLSELPLAEVGEHANHLLALIDQYRANGKRYQEGLQGANPEDRLVLETQLIRLQNNAFKAIQQLAEALLV